MDIEDYIGYDAYEEMLVDKYEQEHAKKPSMKSFVITTVYNIPEIIKAHDESEALDIWGPSHAFNYGIIKSVEELQEN